MTELVLHIHANSISMFFPIVRNGFLVRAEAGITLEAFLCEHAGIPERYLREQVQTIFLDGGVVDDPAASRIGAGSVAALSAALPGVAGAAFRKQGEVSAIRSGITRRDEALPGGPGPPAADGRAAKGAPVLVVLKLFNLVARDLGPRLLERGVIAPAEAVRVILCDSGAPDRAVLSARLDGRTIEAAELCAGGLSLSGQVFLGVAIQ
jgi:hypothetical protein